MRNKTNSLFYLESEPKYQDIHKLDKSFFIFCIIWSILLMLFSQLTK